MFQKNQWHVFCGILISFMLIFSFIGCAKMAVQSDTAAAPGSGTAAAAATTTSGEKSGAAATAASSEVKSALLTEYVVKKGENLWWIAKYKDVYDDAYLWPIIYQANKGEIKNPNRIYPGQKIKIPRDGYTMDDLKKARKKAGAKKPYTPPQGAKPPMK